LNGIYAAEADLSFRIANIPENLNGVGGREDGLITNRNSMVDAGLNASNAG
jgi:hypothetical protein